MNSESMDERRTLGWVLVAAAAVRTAFGIIMAIDAYLKWQPAFAAHYVGYLQNAMKAQPAWLAPWFSFWLRLVIQHTDFFVLATRLIETAIAVGLLLGFARRVTYIAGALFSLLIWSTAEGFGGPYTSGATNLGPALVYALVFVMIALFERLLGSTPYSLDYYISRKFPRWRSLAEWAPRHVWQRPPPILDWDHQLAAIGAVIVALVFALVSLGSATATKASPPTPQNAAAAVSPLSIVSGAPVAHPAPAALPPLISNGDSASVNLAATDTTVEIASGVQYQAWTFGGTVPGPILHVRQGQTVNVSFVNNGNMTHSIDFHAAQIDPSVAYRSVNPREKVEFSFVARTPGAFVYHCGTPPVLQHIGNGMYGAIIVDPAQPLPPADVSYVLVQSEWYTQQVSGTLMSGDYEKMLSVTPDEVVFNGIAFQYNDHPLTAKVGQRIRLYVIDAGPNLASSFHIIGGMFAAVYPDGDANHALTGVSTYPISPGQGVVFDAIMEQPGKYPIVDHAMRDMTIGAAGLLHVTQ
ncbi:MAG TPA: multicopper oxidase domain-containing protein [Candidatus Udaeobacter sp.]|jgi:nitrite reductase (NO-forming)|nr:multicopper oxidase domain-containing protein [Candidatus Udaeobacter sp.]